MTAVCERIAADDDDDVDDGVRRVADDGLTGKVDETEVRGVLAPEAGVKMPETRLWRFFLGRRMLWLCLRRESAGTAGAGAGVGA